MKNKSIFKIGDRVAYIYHITDSKTNDIIYNPGDYNTPIYGAVKKIYAYGSIVIEWDDLEIAKSIFYDVQELKKARPASRLRLESEVKPKWESLNDEFTALHKSIKKKLDIAAQMILEANQECQASNRELEYFCDALEPLKNAMQQVGWDVSTMNC